MPDVNIPKWSSSIIFFGKFMKLKKKSIFEHFFWTRKSKNSVFRGSVAELEIIEKIEKNRKSVRRGWVSWGNHPKPFFQSLGGLCGQYESYTSLVRPFSKSYVVVKLRHLWPIPGNPIPVDLCICDIAEGKLLILGISFCREIFFWELLIRSLDRWNFGFWVKNIIQFDSTTLRNLGSRILLIFTKHIHFPPKRLLRGQI